jgi:hypothetical protein
MTYTIEEIIEAMKKICPEAWKDKRWKNFGIN